MNDISGRQNFAYWVLQSTGLPDSNEGGVIDAAARQMNFFQALRASGAIISILLGRYPVPEHLVHRVEIRRTRLNWMRRFVESRAGIDRLRQSGGPGTRPAPGATLGDNLANVFLAEHFANPGASSFADYNALLAAFQVWKKAREASPRAAERAA